MRPENENSGQAAEQLATALYEKASAEQDAYRAWLTGQPAADVLAHAYEYSVREDILMALEELELTAGQAKALLDSPSPLADIYREWEKQETGYMDSIRDTIEGRANDVARREQPDKKPEKADSPRPSVLEGLKRPPQQKDGGDKARKHTPER